MRKATKRRKVFQPPSQISGPREAGVVEQGATAHAVREPADAARVGPVTAAGRRRSRRLIGERLRPMRWSAQRPHGARFSQSRVAGELAGLAPPGGPLRPEPDSAKRQSGTSRAFKAATLLGPARRGARRQLGEERPGWPSTATSPTACATRGDLAFLLFPGEPMRPAATSAGHRRPARRRAARSEAYAPLRRPRWSETARPHARHCRRRISPRRSQRYEVDDRAGASRS